MYEDYEIPKRRLSEEDVLAMLAEDYRQRESAEYRKKYGLVLTFDTTVADYEETFDVPRRVPELGRSFNEFFGLKIDREICDVLRPPKERTLRDVCRFVVSKNAEAPALRPVSVLGSECAAAGAFVTIRSLLKQAGANVREIAPSTPLAEYTRRHTRAFCDLALMAPGRLPLMTIRWGYLGCAAVVIVACFAVTITNLWVPSPELADWITAIAIASLVLALFFRGRRPREVRFGELKTFRDLCIAVAR